MSYASIGTAVAVATDKTGTTAVAVAKHAKAGALSFGAAFKAELAARKLGRALSPEAAVAVDTTDMCKRMSAPSSAPATGSFIDRMSFKG